MKNLFRIICVFMLLICLFSCSNGIEDEQINVSDLESVEGNVISTRSETTEDIQELIDAILEEEYEPYISTQMQDILSMIDSSTTPIPLENLIPNIDILLTGGGLNEVSLLTKSNATTVATGYSNYSYLYTNVSTSVSATMASNMNLVNGAGTYNVSCVCVTYYLLTNGSTPYSAFENTDIMGMNPDDISQRGYAIEQKVANQLYYLTTYIYEIGNFYPKIPTNNGYLMFNIDNEYAGCMQWRYFAF